MRKLYNYQIIRYFPNINSDEFFNIGVHLANEQKNKLYFIKDEHLTKLITFPSIDKNNITTFIQLLSKEVNLSHWYGNNLKLSETKAFRSSQSFEEVLEILYEDYIGYKFHFKEKKDTIEIIKQTTREIIKKEFSRYIEVDENTIFDFNIINKNHNKHHYSNLGSISNKENIKSIVWDVESFITTNNVDNGVFELLNIVNPIDDIQVSNNMLYKHNIEQIPYYNDDLKYNYLKQMIGV
jgi:hypothetical protein